ncbi:MAG: 3-dehydroquinate synthase, partial [Alistipes sp.]|nr:3-dehydroquinate synthase [Candidatus Minthomonas equi]
MIKSSVTVSDSLSGLDSLLCRESRVIAIVDRKVGELYHHLIPTKERIFIDASEKEKTLSTVAFITGRLLDMEADRNILLLGIGGGITTDIIGFAASIYKRGVRFAFIPTTLLAQVDASIGGKNGVNQNGFKNIIGTFCLPEFVWINSAFLKTLPVRELRNGVSELLKTFIIGNRTAYSEAVKEFGRSEDFSGIDWVQYISMASGIKAQIVENDFRDGGERKKLNLGHSFGHAIERCATAENVDISHGEAVSMGIVIA